MHWTPWFAWLPVTTLAGRRVWLCTVDRRWNWNLNHWGYGGHSGTDGGWEYRFPLAKRP